MSTGGKIKVALRKESVDRNPGMNTISYIIVTVALRKESVDRNLFLSSFVLVSLWSLSARRAWIEIRIAHRQSRVTSSSLSARRAWIEIEAGKCQSSRAGSRSPQGERG